MDQALYQRLVSELANSGVEEIGVFYLGESFLLDWLPEAIAYARKECGIPYVFLTTNGRMATPDKVNACIKAGLNSLKFSFNHSGPDQLQEVTGVDGRNFGIIRENIQKSRAIRDYLRDTRGLECGVYASSILYDREQRRAMEEAVSGILPYVDEHYYLPLYNQGALTTGTALAYGYTPSPGNRGRIGALRDPVPCWSAFTEGHITWDGHLSACCFDHSASWRMGDLKKTSFNESWHSRPFRELRRAHLKKNLQGTPCQECVAWS